jgi:hypothetical protein
VISYSHDFMDKRALERVKCSMEFRLIDRLID